MSKEKSELAIRPTQLRPRCLLSPSLDAALPGARLVLKAMVEITVTFTILTINIFIKVLNDINFCLSSSSFELLSLPQSRQSDNSCQFTHQEIFLRTSRGWLSNYRWSPGHGVVNQGLFISTLFFLFFPTQNPRYCKLL